MELTGWRGRKDMGEAGRVESVIRIYSIVKKKRKKLFSQRKNERKRKQNQH